MIRKTIGTAKRTASFFLTVANSFNPMAYNGVTQKPIASLLGYYLYFTLLLSLSLLAVSLPILANDLSGLEISGEVTTASPIETSLPITGPARIFVNTTASQPAKHDITLTKNTATVKPLYCLANSQFCSLLGVKPRTIPLTGISLSETWLLMLLLPGALAFTYFFLLLKYLALAAIATAISYALAKLSRKDTSLLDAAKISLYAATIPALLDAAITLLNWHGAWALSLLAYAAIITAAVLITDVRSQQGSVNFF